MSDLPPRVSDADLAASPVAPTQAPLVVLHQEDDFIAVSKPSGLLVHRDSHHPEAPAALQVVRDQTGKFVYPFHRLDRATSGVLLFGFSSAAAAALQASLSSPDAHKEYFALMRWPGSNRELAEQWTCERPLMDEKDVPRDAKTEFSLMERFHRCALVRCRIFTGRYHQIRRHANHSGRHIIGDTTHGKGRINAAFRELHSLNRLFLHLHRIRMRHPTNGMPLDLTDPMPMELTSVLGRLRTEDAPGCPPSLA